MAAALVALAVVDHLGYTYGASFGWILLGLAVGGVVLLWQHDYERRKNVAVARRDRARWEELCLAAADATHWTKFEPYCAELLPVQGYRNIAITGSTADDRGVDIIATDQDGTLIAIQVKHRTRGTLGPSVIRELNGATRSGKHRGRSGIVMTNVPMTAGAHAAAEEAGIEIVDRPRLGHWIADARIEIEQRGHAPSAATPPSPATT